MVIDQSQVKNNQQWYMVSTTGFCVHPTAKLACPYVTKIISYPCVPNISFSK